MDVFADIVALRKHRCLLATHVFAINLTQTRPDDDLVHSFFSCMRMIAQVMLMTTNRPQTPTFMFYVANWLNTARLCDIFVSHATTQNVGICSG